MSKAPRRAGLGQRQVTMQRARTRRPRARAPLVSTGRLAEAARAATLRPRCVSETHGRARRRWRSGAPTASRPPRAPPTARGTQRPRPQAGTAAAAAACVCGCNGGAAPAAWRGAAPPRAGMGRRRAGEAPMQPRWCRRRHGRMLLGTAGAGPYTSAGAPRASLVPRWSDPDPCRERVRRAPVELGHNLTGRAPP